MALTNTPPRKSKHESPSHELLSQPCEFNLTKSFCEKISQLIFRIDFHKLNVLRSNMFLKPVLLDGVVF